MTSLPSLTRRPRGRRSRRVVAVLPLLLLGAAAVPLAQQGLRTLTAARQHRGENRLNVDVEYGAGTLRVSPADPRLLYSVRLRYDERGETPVAEWDASHNRLRVSQDANLRRVRNRDRDRSDRRAWVELSRDVPVRLDLEFGAGEARVDLGGLRLEDVEISTGASEVRLRFDTPNPISAQRVALESGVGELKAEGLGNARAASYRFQGGVGEATLDFGGSWNRSARAEVQLGVGALTLRFPRGLGVRINRQSFLTSFDADGMVRRGDAYYSRDYERAPHKLTVDLQAAFGSVEIEWTD